MQRTMTDSVAALGFRVWAVTRFRTMKRAHTHPDIEINYVTEGFIEYLFGGRRRRVGAGTLAVFWGGVPHQITRCSQQGRGIWLTVPMAKFLLWPIPGQFGTRLLGGEIVCGEVPIQTLNRWREDFDSGNPARRAVLWLELEAVLHRLALTQRKGGTGVREGGKGAGASHVVKIAGYLAQSYADEIDLPGVAKAVGLNAKYVARVFKNHTRLTVHAYLTRLRLAHAQRLLASTDLRVVDIALQSGFGSLAAFYAAFKRLADGATPQGYRRPREQSVG